MAISIFDMFKIGIGPSSSHTVGPMKAAVRFIDTLSHEQIAQITRIRIELFGSLGATGVGHGTGPAVLLGLENHQPETIDPAYLSSRSRQIQQDSKLVLGGKNEIVFNCDDDLIYNHSDCLPFHSNGMSFTVFGNQQQVLLTKTYYSIGGGFVIDDDETDQATLHQSAVQQAYPFTSAAELLHHCDKSGLSIAEIMLENEKVWRAEADIRQNILNTWQVMKDCVQAGLNNEGALPGGLNVKRRAPSLHRELTNRSHLDMITPSLGALDWVNLYAMAVNEENAAGGRIVTAPTNGAAGIIPAVLHYYRHWCPNSDENGVIRFLLTAAAIGILFKENASISGAEVGCQGEVGAACAMAAAGLAEATGGTPKQIENAAEIAMEHNLGLTCDPIGGLVQIPCIERNAMASIKAINAATMALRGNGEHFVSLDKVIKTMRDTGQDMLDKYKETSRGGLAVNVVEC